VNAKEGWHGETALMSAAGENHPDVIKLLVEYGADVNAKGSTLDYPLIVKQDVMSLPPVGGLTPLMEAARENSYEAAQALLQAGADPNIQNPEKMTALLIAITNLHWDAARLLIDNGANPSDGSLAQVEEMRNLKEILSRPASKGPHNLTSMDVLKALLDKGAKPDSVIPGEVPTRDGGPGRGGDVPAFSRAAKTADVEVMRMLLDHGADAKIAAKDGSTALIAGVGAGKAAGGPRLGMKAATDAERIAAMQLILDHGADINAADGTGQTALHAAASKGSDEIVQFLADHGAKLDLKDKRDRTALDVANASAGAGPPVPVVGIPVVPVGHETTVALLRKLMGLPPEEKKISAKKDKGEAPSADGNNNNQ
jgi:ankyrin repeat protein